MRRALLIVTIIFIFITIFVAITIYSFSSIKPTTETINSDLASYFSKVVIIPKGIPGPSLDFKETAYIWEMETLEKEVVGVKLKHNTGFTKDQDKIILTLEMEEKGDPSIFVKVLPAIIADKQSLESARNPQKANLNANMSAPYQSLKLLLKPETEQTTRIVWEFKKTDLPQNLKNNYQKLQKIPSGVLGFLYSLPHFIIRLFAA